MNRSTVLLDESHFHLARFGFGNTPNDYTIEPSGCMCVSAHLGSLYGQILPVSAWWECMLIGRKLDTYHYDQWILAQIPSECIFKEESGREEFKRVIASIIYNHSEGVETIIPSGGRSGVFYFQNKNGTFDHVCVQLWDETEKRGRDYTVQWAPQNAHRHNPGDLFFYLA